MEGATPLLQIQPQSQATDAPDALMFQQEQSPAYRALHDAGLIVSTYRKKNASALDLVQANAALVSNLGARSLAYVGGLVVGGLVYDCLMKQFTVRSGEVQPATHSDGTYFFYGPGVHRIAGIWIKLETPQPVTNPRIEHGNCAIVTVPQGSVGLAFDRGQPILLPPGLHQWKSETLRMDRLIDLKENVIVIGPFTLVTVDEGYAAITQDNGKQRVLPGGATHMLTHRNWKFEKFISLKINTDELGPIRATTADNVVLETFATVNWRVEDPTLAARMGAETMLPGEVQVHGGNTPKLRRDVLKQAEASLAAAIGGIRYSDDVHIAAHSNVNAVSPGIDAVEEPQKSSDVSGLSKIFSIGSMTSAVKHANGICVQYGVNVVSINVISACPADHALDEALSAGAVAAAGALQAETAARGNAKAKLISAQAEAEAVRINAQALADAEKLQAQGKKEAAKLLESSEVAVDLARLEKASQLIGSRASFFFGASPQTIPALLSNPKVTGSE